MPHTYTRIGLSVFELRLRDGLNERVDKFVAYMRESYKDDSETKQALTPKEWMEEFKKWSDQEAIQKLAEQYILDIMSDG